MDVALLARKGKVTRDGVAWDSWRMSLLVTELWTRRRVFGEFVHVPGRSGWMMRAEGMRWDEEGTRYAVGEGERVRDFANHGEVPGFVILMRRLVLRDCEPRDIYAEAGYVFPDEGDDGDEEGGDDEEEFDFGIVHHHW